MSFAHKGPADADPGGGRLIVFPTALGETAPAGTARRPGPIEAWLRNGGTPGAFARVRHRFEVREEAAPGVVWIGLDLSDEDLGGFDLRGAMLAGCVLPDVTAADLGGADLTGAVVRLARGATFDEAVLRDGDLEFARLDGASFRGADLRDAVLCGAGLRRAAFAGADLADADLCETDLTGSSIHLARSLRGCDLEGAFGLDAAQAVACQRLGALNLDEALLA